MTIALVHYTYPPVVGGVERVLRDLQSVLQKNGHQADFLPKHHPLLSGTHQPDRPMASPYEVIWVHNVMTMPFDLTLRSHLMSLAANPLFTQKTRLFNSIHDVATQSPAYASMPDETRVELDRFQGEWTHIAVSKEVAQTFHKATQQSASVIPNGIDPATILELTPRIAALAERHDWWCNEIVLLLPARLVPRKRIEDAIHLVETLNASGTKVHLLLTGAFDPHAPNNSPSADYARWLHQRILSSPAAQNIHHLASESPLTPEDVSSLYRICDSVILPSDHEGFGLPALEAALFSKPLLCKPIPTLQNLPGTQPLDLHPDRNHAAVEFIKDLTRDPRLKARKSVLSEHRWQSIYDRAIAPLLTPAN